MVRRTNRATNPMEPIGASDPLRESTCDATGWVNLSRHAGRDLWETVARSASRWRARRGRATMSSKRSPGASWSRGRRTRPTEIGSRNPQPPGKPRRAPVHCAATGDGQDMTARPEPSGTPVSGRLEIPSGPLLNPVRETLAIIDAVHGDGDLPPLPVRLTSGRTEVGGYRCSERGGEPPHRGGRTS